MSDMSAYYGDFGLGEAGAIRTRKKRNIANTQAAALGQLRGKRNIAELQRIAAEGFQPVVGSYGRRGFGGPNVNSGIRTAGLERYAADLQRNLGAESFNLQDILNNSQLDDMDAQNDLENYVEALRLQKQANILASAQQIKSFT